MLFFIGTNIVQPNRGRSLPMADLHRLRLSLCPCLTDSGIIFPQKSK
jgi:hypothetical protein